MTDTASAGDTVQPRWQRVFTAIRAEIKQNCLPAGSKLPPERELARLHGVSRFTVRLALAALEADGLVHIEHGRGLFVAEQVVPFVIGARTRFSENIRRLNLNGRREYLGDRVEFASQEVRRMLDLPEGAEVVSVEMLSRIDERPIALVRDFYPLPRFAGIGALVRQTGSATVALGAFGVRDYFRKSSRIASRPATSYEAGHLEMRQRQPLLVTYKLEIDDQGLPLTCGESCFRGDRVNLVIE